MSESDDSTHVKDKNSKSDSSSDYEPLKPSPMKKKTASKKTKTKQSLKKTPKKTNGTRLGNKSGNKRKSVQLVAAVEFSSDEDEDEEEYEVTLITSTIHGVCDSI
jgi:hypothetical protein